MGGSLHSTGAVGFNRAGHSDHSWILRPMDGVGVGSMTQDREIPIGEGKQVSREAPGGPGCRWEREFKFQKHLQA